MSRMARVLIAGLLVFLRIDSGHFQTDPCTDYVSIDMHEGRRESDYQPTPDDQLFCDDDIDPGLWTRFVREELQLSYKLTTTECIEIDHCGTSSPLWIQKGETHPAVVGVDVQAKICLNYGLAFCCSLIGDATIRLCKDRIGDKFYVYKLPKPHGCYTGYCVDRMAGSCDPKFRKGPNGDCIPMYPPQNRPTLKGPMIDGTTIKFSCQVDYTGDNDTVADARFDVFFLFDGIVDPGVPVVTVKARDKALLKETDLQGHLGTEISCGSRAFWQFDPDTKGDESRSSNGYFIGVRADTNRITVREEDGLPKEVVLKATLPVLCKDPNQPCRACTRLVTEGMTSIDEQCEYCFKPEDWKPNEENAYDSTSPLRVSAVKDPRLDKPNIYFIDFQPFTYEYEVNVGTSPDALWTGYEMNDIAVTFTDSIHGICDAWGDPHVTTFDGKYYHLFHIGQFLMWRSNAPRHFEVHVRLWSCNPSRGIPVSCICAVAVREGNAILGIDICGSRSTESAGRTKIMRYSPSTWNLPTGAFVSSDGGSTYFVNMPSGSYVRTVVYSSGMNIFIHGLPEDKFVSSGLCGNFDGDKQNDLTLKGTNIVDPTNDQERDPIPVHFSKSYRIDPYKSFFDSIPQWMDLPDPDIIKCRCNQGTVDCSPNESTQKTIANAQFRPVLLQAKDKGNNQTRRKRKKRSVDNSSDNLDEEEDNFDYGENFEPNTQASWPTPSGLTESQARDLCQNALTALPYAEDCFNKTNVDMEDTIQGCIEDIKITDDTSWAQTSVDSFESRCVFKLLENPDSYTKGPDGELVPPNSILGKICPNQCNGQGACKDGACDCNAGFTGVDCSLEEGVPPVLHYIPGSGRCDLTQRPCKEFRLIASQFKQSDKLTCRVTELSSKASAVDVPVSHDPTVTAVSDGAATFVTSAEVACKLPEIVSQDMAYYQLLFDFSYDGQEYSNKINLTVFDGDCLECPDECDEPANWKMLPGTCIIDGMCVRAGEYDSSGCYTCDPNHSRSEWTNSSDGCVDLSTSALSTTAKVPSTKSPNLETEGSSPGPSSSKTDGSTPRSASSDTTKKQSTEFVRQTTTTSGEKNVIPPKVSPTSEEPNSTLAAPDNKEGGDDDLRIVIIATSVAAVVVLAIVTVAVIANLYKAKYPRGKPGPHKMYSAPSEASLSARSPEVESPRQCWGP